MQAAWARPRWLWRLGSARAAHTQPPLHRSRRSAKPVSSVRVRGVSAVQSHRLCIPRICFVSARWFGGAGRGVWGSEQPLTLPCLPQDQSYRKPKQRRRHCVAYLLGGVRPVWAGRVLQRSTSVLVPFLLRGQGGHHPGHTVVAGVPRSGYPGVSDRVGQAHPQGCLMRRPGPSTEVSDECGQVHPSPASDGGDPPQPEAQSGGQVELLPCVRSAPSCCSAWLLAPGTGLSCCIIASYVHCF